MNNATLKNGDGPIASTIKPSNQHSNQSTAGTITENGVIYPIVDCMLIPPIHLAFWCHHCRRTHWHGTASVELNIPRLRVGAIAGHRWPHCGLPDPKGWERGYYLRVAQIVPASHPEQRPRRKTRSTVVSADKLREVVRRVVPIDQRFATVQLSDNDLSLGQLSFELASVSSDSDHPKAFKRHVAQTRRMVLSAAEYLP